MTRRELLAGAPAALLGAAPKRKNVLLLMCDEHKPHAFGIDGDPLARTPNLDGLARESVRFDHAYCTSPVCVPSRFSMMTGLYPHKGRIYGNNNPWPADVKTLGNYFGAAGYSTASIGKMHAVDSSSHGFERLLESKDWFEYLGPKRKIWDDENNKNGRDDRKGPCHVGRVSLLPEEDHFESWVARESIQYLRNRKADRPFFLISSFIKPHDPFMPVERFAKLYPPEKMKLPDTCGESWISRRCRKGSGARCSILRKRRSCSIRIRRASVSRCIMRI